MIPITACGMKNWLFAIVLWTVQPSVGSVLVCSSTVLTSQLLRGFQERYRPRVMAVGLSDLIMFDLKLVTVMQCSNMYSVGRSWFI